MIKEDNFMYFDKIHPKYTPDGVPWCSKECPSKSGSYCNVSKQTITWAICIPVIKKNKESYLKLHEDFLLMNEKYEKMKNAFETTLVSAINDPKMDNDDRISMACEMISWSRGTRIHEEEAKEWLISKGLLK